MRAVRFHEFGGPEVLRVDEVPDPVAGQGEVLVEVTAIGLNYGETLQRSRASSELYDWYPEPALPVIPGVEVTGVVREVGPEVSTDLVGTEVVGFALRGAYAELAVLPAAGAVPVPPGLDARQALALFLQGVTAAGLMDAARIQAGERVLIEAAAGGVGSLLVQLVTRAGATAVALARGDAKLAAAKELGADETVDYSTPDWTSGLEPVDVALSSVGGTVTRSAFDLLRDGVGRMVVYGTASGSFADIAVKDLVRKGVGLIGLRNLAGDPAYAAGLLADVFALGASGELSPVLGESWPLAEAAAAHRALEARTTTGKTFLIP
ncbi:zinc-binding alcohol dehydrogenase family protein [Umezawaea endophytica]|uniref:Zinc-binding dehydrogenase n=1 Tax=Umezawaea endophytica TaxID=1654476 RepID=A0A9X3AKC4_9PSEU|nr:zinc-binding dehydrogenase [Umezawaea endophytica]MCS7482670.1 zinc-binding dehydrogenase [Umezawaea endophytica]